MAEKSEKKAVSKPDTKQSAELPQNGSLIDGVDVEVSVELGRHRMTLDEALDIGEASLVELHKMMGEPVDVRLNGKLFARGEVVTVNENFGVRLTEILRPGAQESP